MVSFADLWLPIVLSAAFVFVLSSVLHMLLPLHRTDFGQLPNEDRVLEALRTHGVGPGNYMFPRAACMKDMSNPEMIAKFKQGPVGTVMVLAGAPAIGRSLFQWFLFSLLVGALAGGIGALSLPVGASYPSVFKLVGLAAVLGYALADFPASIWKGQKWSTTFKFAFDGLLYGLVTGGTFGWLWPQLG